jgi:predicted Zn-dependent peptidase
LALLILFGMAPSTATASIASPGQVETVSIGGAKVLMCQSEEYGDQASVFAIMLAGHGQQTPDEAHCAHVAEHTVFRNLTKYPEALVDWVWNVDRSGANPWILCNGWTGVDHTQFNLTVPGECLPEALGRLIDGMFPEAIDRDAYATEMDSRLKGELDYMTTHQV